jgi:hypothetical protein
VKIWREGCRRVGGYKGADNKKIMSYLKTKDFSTSRKHTSLPNLSESNARDKGLCGNVLRSDKYRSSHGL